MSGTINLAFTQQFDMDGRPLSGGLLYFYAAGTSTPQNVFQNTALTITLPNPLVLDASGRVPMFYLADGFIKIRLTDSSGLVIIAADQLLVIGPSTSGGGGGGAVNPDAILQTGDIKARYGEGTLTGFVRCNGRSIGKTTGTEAFGDTMQPLFEYLWQFSNITLNTGKGATANADWLALRTLNLPDLRGRTIAGTDDMGATAAARLTAAGLGVAATTLGNAGAAETVALATANLPNHVHTGSTDTDGSHVHTGGTTGIQNANHTHNGTTDGESGHTHDDGSYTAAGNTALTHAKARYRTDTFAAGATPFVTSVGAATGADLTDAVAVDSHTHDITGTSGNSSGHSHTFTSAGMSNDHGHPFSVPNTGSTHSHNFSTSGTTGAVATPVSKTQPTMVLTYYIKL